MSNVMLVPPSMLLVQLFRKSKPRKTRVENIKDAMHNIKSDKLNLIKT